MHATPTTSTAAPGSAQDARARPVTNHTAPVDAGSCAAVEMVGGRRAAPLAPKEGGAHGSVRVMGGVVRATLRARAQRNTRNAGGPASGAGIAGMAGSAGVGRPVTSRPIR